MSFLKVKHQTHMLLSALLWSFFGVKMNYTASNWLLQFDINQMIYLIILGVAIGLLFAFFLFSKIVKKNIIRIKILPAKSNILRFHSVKSYLLITFMIILGASMRKYGLVPETVLGVIYTAIGIALFTASFVYYKELFFKRS